MAKRSRSRSDKSASGQDSRARSRSSRWDWVIALVFIVCVVFLLLAYRFSILPMKEDFALVPASAGAVFGLAAGFAVAHLLRHSSPFQVAGVLALGFACLAPGLILALNRPLDRSELRHHSCRVLNRFEWGNSENRTHFLEVEGFPVRRVVVELPVYEKSPVGSTVDIQTRSGFFGLEYLEGVAASASRTGR